MTKNEQIVLDLIEEWGGIDGGHHKLNDSNNPLLNSDLER